MDMTAFIPRKYHHALKVLGRHEWLHVQSAGEGKHTEDIDHAVVDGVWARLSKDEQRLLTAFFGKPLFRESALVLSKLLADGPKCFRPTFAQCEAMENVTLDITLGDYRQPYPAIVIEFPHEYVRSRNVPQRIAMYHNAEAGYCFMLAGAIVQTNPAHRPVFQTMNMTLDHETMEQKLNRVDSDDLPERGMEEIERARLAERVALNCNLLLTQYKTRLIDQLPRYADKLRKQASSKSKETAERARLFLAGEFKVVEFEQEINFFDEEVVSQSPANGLPTGRSVRPHWRKGYWRRQACGAGWSEHRVIFIRPVLVRKDRFVGDVGSTSVAYLGAERGEAKYEHGTVPIPVPPKVAS